MALFTEGKLFRKAGEGAGGGGGDQHNLGWYATQAALEEAHPTATAGDWAIIGATDTVWIWDTDNSAWVDSDQKGQVTSVNGQTGDVTLTIPAAQVNSDWNANSGVAQILNKPTIPDAIQVSAMPTASATEEDKIYQFTGTTDANYTNGYFYKCVSDGQQPATYSWTRVDVQPQAGGLPDQTGNSGKFLITNGTDASWGTTIASYGGIDIRPYTAYATQRFLCMVNGNVLRNICYHTEDGWTVAVDGYHSCCLDTTALYARFGNLSLGKSSYKWGNVYTQKLNNGGDITVPTTGGTMAVINIPATAPELAVADWSSNTQTITVTGVTASNVVLVSPAPASAADYAAAGIICTAQATDSLTFTCTTVPTNAITLSVVIL